jgi:hypothetical protein
MNGGNGGTPRVKAKVGKVFWEEGGSPSCTVQACHVRHFLWMAAIPLVGRLRSPRPALLRTVRDTKPMVS